MARELRLYNTPLFNNGDHLHLFTRNNANYLTYIETYRIATISLDNYRINTDVAKCYLKDNLTEANYDRVTYIADVDTTTGYCKYYHVINASIQSKYVNFNLEVDLWATNIAHVGIAVQQIFRSTRLLGGGFYDEIKLTDGRMQYELYDGQASLAPITHYKSSAVWLVFLLQYNVEQAYFGEDHVSQTELYGASLSDLASKATGTLASGRTDLEKALAIVGGVYGVSSSGIGDNDAQVLRAWIIPHNEIEDANYGLTIKSKSHFNSQSVDVQVSKILPSHWHNQHVINNYDPNRVYYAGTINNGLKLRNYAGTTLTYYTHVYVGDSDIKVIVQQGERQQDITQGYEVKLTTNGAQKTELRKLADAFSTSVSLGTSSYNKMATLGGAGGVGFSLAGLDITKGIADMVGNFGVESARGNGDGFLTYYQTNPLDEVLSPYCVTYFTSVNDEVNNAYAFGLNYANKYYEESLSYYLINETPIIANWVDFLQCKAVVSGAQKQASDFIEGELLHGIHLQDIDA